MSVLSCICAHGSLCIAAGRHEEAIDVFNEALVVVREMTSVFGDFHCHGQSTCMMTDCIRNPPYLECSTLEDQSPYHHLHEHSRSKQIFKKPLGIPNTEFCSYEQYQFIILYNLALSYHMCSVKHQNEEMLKVSLNLWTLVHEFHWNDDLGLLPIHTCAILNNLGHIYHLLGNQKASRECHENLLRALLVLQRNEDSSLPGYNADCFFRSIAPLILEDSIAARAA